MKMTIENAETVRIDGYSTFVVGFDDTTVEAFAKAFNAAFANKDAANIYNMLSFVGNATEDTNAAINEGYLTEADRISEIISIISQFGEFDDESNDEKTLDTAVDSDIMGTESKQAFQSKETTMNVKKTLSTVVVWYNPTTNKVSLAKDRVTGKFVKLDVAQGLLNVELNTFHVPTVDTVEMNYSFLAMMMFVVAALLAIGVTALVIGLAVHATTIVAALFALLIPAFAGLAAISLEE